MGGGGRRGWGVCVGGGTVQIRVQTLFLLLGTSYDVIDRIKTRKRFKRTLFIRTKHQHANFRGNSLYQATKRHLCKR